eukprot:646311_1
MASVEQNIGRRWGEFGECSFLVKDVPDLSKLSCVSKTGLEFEILKPGNNALVILNHGGAHQVFELSYDHKEITGGIIGVMNADSGVRGGAALVVRQIEAHNLSDDCCDSDTTPAEETGQ